MNEAVFLPVVHWLTAAGVIAAARRSAELAGAVGGGGGGVAVTGSVLKLMRRVVFSFDRFAADETWDSLEHNNLGKGY